MAAKKVARDEREVLVLRRNFPVAPQVVWRAWIDSAALRIWFGQSDVSCWEADMDVRPGGRLRLVMQDTVGNCYEAHGVYREVVPDRRLVFGWSWKSGADGVDAATHAVITVNLKPVDQGTELEFTLDPVTDPRESDAWRADFKRLAVLLKEKS